MKIIKTNEFRVSLQNILRYIQKDKVSISREFNTKLNKYLSLLKANSQMGKRYKKIYRKLVFKGYSIIYKIDNDIIYILDIFKWQDK